MLFSYPFRFVYGGIDCRLGFFRGKNIISFALREQLTEEDIANVSKKICRNWPPYKFVSEDKSCVLVFNKRDEVRKFIDSALRTGITERDHQEPADPGEHTAGAAAQADHEPSESGEKPDTAGERLEEYTALCDELEQLRKNQSAMIKSYQKLLEDFGAYRSISFNRPALKALAEIVREAGLQEYDNCDELENLLKSFGCVPIEPAYREKFNAREHECYSSVPLNRRRVRSVVQKGWKLNCHVIEKNVLLPAEVTVEEESDEHNDTERMIDNE